MPLRKPTAAAVTLVLAAAGVAAEERLPIIDMHQHARLKVLRGPDGQPMPRPCEPRPRESTPARYTTDESIRLGTLAEMKRHGVVLGFLSDRHLQGLMEAGLGKRVMFGSDQMEWPEAIGLRVEAIESAPFLTPAQRRDILYHNAARFLRLEPGESPVR
jgi:hypothetical protein